MWPVWTFSEELPSRKSEHGKHKIDSHDAVNDMEREVSCENFDSIDTSTQTVLGSDNFDSIDTSTQTVLGRVSDKFGSINTVQLRL